MLITMVESTHIKINWKGTYMKKFGKKLQLKRSTVTDLTPNSLKEILGGCDVYSGTVNCPVEEGGSTPCQPTGGCNPITVITICTCHTLCG